jgi:hypothetical protein
LDAANARELVERFEEQLGVLREIGGHDLEQHARLTGQDVTGDNLRQISDLFAQHSCARPLDLQARKGCDAEPDRATVDDRSITDDIAGFLHTPHAP